MALSPYAENLLLRNLLTNGTVPRPTAWYVGLHVGAAGATGAANEIATTLGYSRQPQTFSVAGNLATGVSALVFGPDITTPWGTVTDFSLWDAPTGGNCLWLGTVGTPILYNVADSATLAASALTFTLT